MSWDNRSLEGVTRSAETSEALFYVFESSEGKGFVIVSADDQVMPVLGYSFENEAPQPDNLPAPMKDWIVWITEQIKYVRDNHIENRNAAPKWAEAMAGNVVIELETAQWGQRKPFNNQCALDGDERSLAGCVPTATAIIMKYHEWPKYGVGKTESYYTKTKHIFVESRDLNHEYDWELMPMNYYSHSGYSEEEADAVSTLMADIGSAFQSNYSKNSTSTGASDKVLYEHFGYSPAMYYVYRKYYSDDVWLQMIKDELRSLRPLSYSGGHENGRHRFVLDGYTDDDYFHVNWGWGGQSNGYFTLSTLTPGDGEGYSDDQCTSFNFKPDTSSEVEDWIRFIGSGITVSETEFVQDSRFYIDELHFKNFSSIDYTGYFRGAITDRTGNIKEWITRELVYTPEVDRVLESGRTVRWTKISATITEPINSGDRIRVFYRAQDSDKWHLVKSSNQKDCRWEVLVAPEVLEPQKYEVRWMVDGEVIRKDSVAVGETVEYGGEIPTKEGYTFCGWSDIPETMPANDVVITGIFIQVDAIADVADTKGDKIVGIYTLDGKKGAKPVPGNVYFIRYASGKVVKRMIK